MKSLTEILAMSPEEQRVKCAEVCGWYQRDEALYVAPPNYASSLDAMHEAEKSLTPDQLHEYERRLRIYVNTQSKDDDWSDPRGGNAATKVFHATAAQRLAAFLSVML